MISRTLTLMSASALALAGACAGSPLDVERWTEAEVQTLRSLWLGSLAPLPPDPSNRWADDDRAAALGHRLFFDERLSIDGKVSCASCHRPEAGFQDGIALGQGVGTTDRRTMPIAGTAYGAWQFWDGRKDTQWAQALGPLESPVEHGGSRALYVHLLAEHYRSEYEAVFGPLPELHSVPRHAGPVPDAGARAAWDALPPAQAEAVNRAFVNLGKAVAAYERRIQHAPGRFDRYVDGLLRDGRAPANVLTGQEVDGLRLFIGKAGCTQCHNGPLFTNHDFHNTGVAEAPGLPMDRGRSGGAPAVLADEFNCRSPYSDAGPSDCSELDFMIAEGPQLERAFKTPGLRGVAERAPYMHAGQLATLADVISHYDDAPPAPAGHTEIRRLRLSATERAQLEAFLRTLSGPLVAPPGFLSRPER